VGVKGETKGNELKTSRTIKIQNETNNNDDNTGTAVAAIREEEE
jgi:hypothetical protein